MSRKINTIVWFAALSVPLIANGETVNSGVAANEKK